jgi:hypothetical protein
MHAHKMSSNFSNNVIKQLLKLLRRSNTFQTAVRFYNAAEHEYLIFLSEELLSVTIIDLNIVLTWKL